MKYLSTEKMIFLEKGIFAYKARIENMI